MIQDLDGGDPGPSRAGVVRAISVVLAVAALISYAALTSPTLKGPYATPDPAAGVSIAKLDLPRYTPAPFVLVDPAAAVALLGGCIVPPSAYTTTIFTGGEAVVVSRPITLSPLSSCVAFWNHPPDPLPFDRFAR